MAVVTMAKALNDALRSALEHDPKVLILGEDRVIDSPLAESGIVGAAVGLAMRGFRPVCEIQFDGFVYPAFDQISSQLAKLHYRSQGRLRMPVVVRVPFGGGIGAVEHHSESPESLFAHVPGLKVVACASPSDAHWMLRQAIACDDPVMFFEPKRRYWEKGEVAADPEPLFASRVARTGSTATLVCYGPMVRTCLDAAAAAEPDGHDLEVIDLRTLSPLDLGPVFESVRRTGRLVVVAEAPSEVSVAAEVAARVQEECFHSLEAPVLRVTGFNTPYPPSRVEDYFLPDLDRVLDAVDRAMAW